MAKVHPEIVLDVNKLPETVTTELSHPPTTPRELPEALVDFKAYVDSKCCYHSAPFETVELVSFEAKIAYKCQMKILVEDRDLSWTVKPSRWNNERIFLSTTIGMFRES